MRQIVHLKLSAEYPPEVREAAVVRDEDGRCSALLKVKKGAALVDITIPFAPCSELSFESMMRGPGKLLGARIGEPDYERLMDALQRLSRSME